MTLSEGVRFILVSIVIGGICLAYNRPLSNEIARVFLLPIGWIVGGKQWTTKAQQYLAIWIRFTLYAGALMTLIIIVLTVFTLLILAKP